jgi:hypothetical protein
MTIVDVEKDRTPAPAAQTSSSYSDISDEPYVYDIYIADTATALVADAIDLNDLRLVVMDDVYCSYYAFM